MHRVEMLSRKGCSCWRAHYANVHSILRCCQLSDLGGGAAHRSNDEGLFQTGLGLLAQEPAFISSAPQLGQLSTEQQYYCIVCKLQHGGTQSGSESFAKTCPSNR